MVGLASLLVVAWFFGGFNGATGQIGNGTAASASSRPEVVNIGALFTFNSIIGRAAMPAINLAVEDVNADPTILVGTKLNVIIQDTNCSGFVGTIEGELNFLNKSIFLR